MSSVVPIFILSGVFLYSLLLYSSQGGAIPMWRDLQWHTQCYMWLRCWVANDVGHHVLPHWNAATDIDPGRAIRGCGPLPQGMSWNTSRRPFCSTQSLRASTGRLVVRLGVPDATSTTVSSFRLIAGWILKLWTQGESNCTHFWISCPWTVLSFTDGWCYCIISFV